MQVYINQTLIVLSVAIIIIMETIFKPFVKKCIDDKVFKTIIYRLIIALMSIIGCYLIKEQPLTHTSLTVFVLSSILYDISGFKLIKNKIKERLQNDTNVINKNSR